MGEFSSSMSESLSSMSEFWAYMSESYVSMGEFKKQQYFRNERNKRTLMLNKGIQE
jgi:hypothetical protein